MPRSLPPLLERMAWPKAGREISVGGGVLFVLNILFFCKVITGCLWRSCGGQTGRFCTVVMSAVKAALGFLTARLSHFYTITTSELGSVNKVYIAGPTALL